MSQTSETKTDVTSSPFLPELEVSMDLYPPSDVDASQRDLRDDEFYVEYLEIPFTAGQLHMLRTLVSYYHRVAPGQEAKFWREVMLFYRRIYGCLPAQRILNAMKFRIIHDCTVLLFDASLSVPDNVVLRSPHHFWTRGDKDRDDDMWKLYAEWNAVTHLKVALTAVFGEGWCGVNSLPENSDANVVKWGYRAREFVYEMNITTTAIEGWFEEFDEEIEMSDV
ncbi:hypothetical protein BDZ89DRAFT_1144900 [Hymenopellis radicata]|nr:hypothetical protein BDZ89DRAFT_1144900 [Hymenopellis radicata]